MPPPTTNYKQYQSILLNFHTMEASSSSAVLALALLAALALLSKILFAKRPKLPPGPKPWPIIGNLNLLGPLPHQSLHKLSQTYGPVMQLKFGSYPVVVASSPEMTKQFSKTHDHIFASRPQTAAGKYLTYDYLNVTWAPYGPYWRQGRKIFLTELFSSKRLESFRYIRVEENRAFASRLYALSGKAVVLKEHLSRLNLSIMSRIVLGKEYFSLTDFESSIMSLKEFQDMLDELFLLNGVSNIGDWIPWLDFLDLQGYVKRMKAVKKKMDRFYEFVLHEHKARKEGVQEFVAKDMVDLLLQLVDDPNDLEVKLTYDSIKAFTQDLIAGGTDTSASLLEWAMSELIKQPNLIEKATEELDRVIGKERWVEEKDLENLPYMDAIMKETMRKHPAVVMLPPHLALEDCNVAGYDVRKGTLVLVNLWSMGRDPTLWDAPDEFRPERFLGKAIDVKGQSFELLPFGSGRRMCPGYSLGLKMIGSCLANVLHGFNWKLPENVKVEDLGMEEVYGLVTPRKFPLVAVTEPRLPIHLY
ncbi:PREDICTED: flavonoid 3'-monooxygenase-like [Prunus mume]|uniref:Flavonoid 3'-monooxygenase-like n=1 Tax=Prunus mume TaxID=102107 RepID=A0ABM0PNR6_PRUMU|nr:PREDICTED: flavonoid 3'-monooxygenase-like [Prunus mume]